jgi:hypothetical protein
VFTELQKINKKDWFFMYISARREGRTHSVQKPKRNLKPVSREFANVPGDILPMDELVTFLGIQTVISYHRLPESRCIGNSSWNGACL